MYESSDQVRNPHVNERFVSEPAVVARGVGKRYVLRGADAEGAGRRSGRGGRSVDALRNVTFVAERGEAIGIVGRNGSGKSTLLRIISGAEASSEGSIEVSHQPVLLGVSPALQGWLTGEQNAYLGLLALGMDNKAAKSRIEEIVEWAELGEASTRPMNTYSSGMGSRLSFAISTSIRPEILLVDEALSTGDAAFADKAQSRMEELLKGAGTLFLVSHSLSVIEKNCSRGLWIHNGDLIWDGPIDEVVEGYREFSDLLKSGKDRTADLMLDGYKKKLCLPEVSYLTR